MNEHYGRQHAAPVLSDKCGVYYGNTEDGWVIKSGPDIPDYEEK